MGLDTLYVAACLPLLVGALRCWARCARARSWGPSVAWWALGLLLATAGIDSGLSLKTKAMSLPSEATIFMGSLVASAFLYLLFSEWRRLSRPQPGAYPSATIESMAIEAMTAPSSANKAASP